METKKEEPNYRLISTAFGTILVSFVLIIAAYLMGLNAHQLEPANEKPLSVVSILTDVNIQAVCINFTLLAVGAVIGWLFGIMLSPYDSDETEKFSVYAKAASVFISGYLVAKIGKVVEKISDPGFYADSLTLFRVLSFFACVILAMIVVFAFRRYSKETKSRQKPRRQKPRVQTRVKLLALGLLESDHNRSRMVTYLSLSDDAAPLELL